MLQKDKISCVLARNNVKVLAGDGPVLLYAHGFGCNQNMWDRVTPAFKSSHKQVLFDYVGSGQSDITAVCAKRAAAGMVRRQSERVGSGWLHHITVFISRYIGVVWLDMPSAEYSLTPELIAACESQTCAKALFCS